MINLLEQGINPIDSVDIKLHHIGYACKDISEALEYFKSFHNVEQVSQIIYDPLQRANVCLLTIENSADIELVSGEPVRHLIKNGTCIYHLCYETDNIQATIDYFKQQGGIQLDKPTPAKLFNGRIIVFIQTKIGLIELLEKEPKVLPNKSWQKISIIGTFSVDSIRSCLSSLCKRYHFPYEIESLNYDSINICLADVNSELNNNKLNIILLREQDFIKDSEKLNDFINALSFSASQNKSHVILGLCPSNYNHEQTQLFNKSHLIKQFAHHENITLIDFCFLTNNLGDHIIYDEITDREAQIPYKPYFDKLLVTHILKKIYACYHNTYKVVVVDCDDTLWTGICGEDPIDRLRISDANALLQKKLLLLRENGFLICICSKNHEDDVRNIFSEHPDMILSDSDITAWQINWNDKTSNLKALSSILNLPLSSFIFVDDNPLEIAQVEDTLNEVLSIQFTNDMNKLNLILNNIWAFDKERATTQADERREWYSTHLKREEFKANFKDIEEFIADLKINISIAKADCNNAARLAELSDRVTQFNFTNKKYNTHEITSFIGNDKNIHVFKVNLNDKYGDYGLVGSVIASTQNNDLTIESFMLSCRALNRGVENKMLCYLADFARNLNIKDIVIPFIQTSRNSPAKMFLNTLNAGIKNINDEEIVITIDASTKNLFASKSSLVSKMNDSNQSTQSKDSNLLISKKEMFELLDLTTINSPPGKTGLNNNNSEIKNVSDALNNIWKGLLEVNSINDSDNFFSLGGDSLSALRLLSQTCEYFKIDIKLYEIFEHPTFCALLSLINKRLSSCPGIDKERLPALEKQTNREPHDLSYNQKSLWLLDKLYGSSWFYNINLTAF